MAITERYVESIAAWVNATAYTTTPLSLVKGSDGNGYYCILAHTSETGVKGRPIDGTDYATYWTICDGTATKPWTLAQSFTNAVAGDRVNVKVGTYAQTTTALAPAAGSSLYPVHFRGYSSSIGDGNLGRAATGALVTTNMPTITFTTGSITTTANDGIILESLNIEGATADVVVRLDDHCALVNCKVVNTNASGKGCRLDANAVYLGCDISCTGATSGVALEAATANIRIIDCRINNTNGNAINCTGPGLALIIAHSVIYNCSYGIYCTAANTDTLITLINVTGYGITNAFFYGPNTAVATPAVFVNCHVTDCGIMCDSQYSATANVAIFRAYNRTRDNTAADDGYPDWPLIGVITTDTGDHTTDYTDATTGDFRLIAAAPGKGAGRPLYLDCGGLQREEPAAGGGGQRILGGSIVR